IRVGSTTLGEVFARAAEPSDASSEDAEVCSFVYLVKIAEAVPGIGKVKARRILEQHHLSERTRVGDVPLQVRALLLEALS
ncbi:MAG: hypothetical protein ACO3QU_07500, partial [Ilumatobacteraceae bacterium]